MMPELLLQSQPLPHRSSLPAVGVAAAYFAVCAVIAIWAARRTRTRDDFFVAGRGIGLWTMTLAAMAATLSGFIFIGGPGLLYATGIGALFIALSASLTTPLSAWLLAGRMRALRDVRGAMTVPDAVGARYRSPVAQGVCAAAILVATVGYIATNLLALGLVLAAIFPLSLVAGIWIGATVVLAYSATGGILAGVYTDVFQGTIKAVASVLVFIAVLRSGHGLGGISHIILAHEAGFIGPWGHLTPLAALSLFFLFGVGTLGQPHVISKYYMLKDPSQLRWYPLLMTLVLIVTLLLFFGIGLGVKAAVLSGDILRDLFTGGDFDVSLDGQRPLLDAMERSHMRDVGGLVRILVGVLAAAVVVFALTRTRLRDRRRGGRLLLLAATSIGAAAVLLAVVFAVAFEPAFLAFHRLFFSEGTYLFGPDSNLIKLFPEGFWFESSLVAGGTIVLGALLVGLRGWRLRGEPGS